jgi:hypothetical protein
MIEVTVRVYGPLNHFVPAYRRQVPWRRGVDGHPSVKDFIEGIGGPQPETGFSSMARPLHDLLREVPKSAVAAALLPKREHYHHFEMCSGCSRVYWKGSHWTRLKHAIDAARAEAEGGAI